MTKEDKELLIKDLCARLPYHPIVSVAYNYADKGIVWEFDVLRIKLLLDIEEEDSWEYVKPYLRPLKSMTEEERKEIEKITNNSFYANSNYIANFKSQTYGDWHGNWHSSYNNYPLTNVECNKLISWLDKNHFDHRTDDNGKTLIEKGLAIEVTEENNPYKE